VKNPSFNAFMSPLSISAQNFSRANHCRNAINWTCTSYQNSLVPNQ
jgi:hypothetical protein